MTVLPATAYDFKVDGIYYNVTSATDYSCEVTIGDTPYSGEFSIPEKVEYEGSLYTVTSIGNLGENSLSELVIPSSIISLENFAFNSSKSLKRIIIQDSETPINVGYAYYTPSDDHSGYGLFYYCPLEYIYIGRPMKYKLSSEYGCGPIGYHLTLKTAELGGWADCGLGYNNNLFHNIPTLERIAIGGNITSINNLCSNCPNVSRVDISAPIINMNSAFSGCEMLETIALGSEVREMRKAFAGCIGLKSVNVPEGVKDLSYTFSGCSSLTTINLPESIENLDHTFWKCSSLTGAIVPSSAQNMNETFYNCAQLTTVNIPDGIKSLSSTFVGCSSLSSIEIPEGVENLSNTFYGCSSLTNLKLPQTVRTVSGAFSGCSLIESLNLPEGIKSLGSYTFSNCTNLSSLTLPSSLSNLGQYCFSDCSSLQTIDIPVAVTELGVNVFLGWTGVRNLRIPGNVISIRRNAFGSNSNIEELTIDDVETTLTIDGAENNGECKSVLTLPGMNTLKVGRPLVFKRSENYQISHSYPPLSGIQAKHVVFFGHAGVSFKSYLTDCKKLETVVFDNVKPQYLDHMLSGCTSIKSFVIPESATSIVGLFDGATSLTETIIPSGITSLRYTFNRCSSLTSIQIPETVINLDYAFSGCSSLKSVDIPNSVTSMQNAFSSCTNLRNVNIPENVENMHSSFVNCINLEKAIIPASVTDDNWAFSGCSSLKYMFVDNEYALNPTTHTFDNNLNLDKLTIGSNVSKVGSVLQSVENIREMECLGNTPPSGPTNSFSSNVYENCKLVIPQDEYDQYKNIYPWRRFVNISENCTSGIGKNYIDSKKIIGIFNLNGSELRTDINSLPSGIYIIKYDSGECVKIAR